LGKRGVTLTVGDFFLARGEEKGMAREKGGGLGSGTATKRAATKELDGKAQPGREL